MGLPLYREYYPYIQTSIDTFISSFDLFDPYTLTGTSTRDPDGSRSNGNEVMKSYSPKFQNSSLTIVYNLASSSGNLFGDGYLQSAYSRLPPQSVVVFTTLACFLCLMAYQTLEGYLLTKPSFFKNSGDTI